MSYHRVPVSILLLGSFVIFLCQEKARGKSGPLFHFDVHEVFINGFFSDGMGMGMRIICSGEQRER